MASSTDTETSSTWRNSGELYLACDVDKTAYVAYEQYCSNCEYKIPCRFSLSRNMSLFFILPSHTIQAIKCQNHCSYNPNFSGMIREMKLYKNDQDNRFQRLMCHSRVSIGSPRFISVRLFLIFSFFILSYVCTPISIKIETLRLMWLVQQKTFK